MKYNKLTIGKVIQGKIGNFLNKFIKSKNTNLPLEGYTLVKDLTPSYTSRVNRVGIYKGIDEKKVVIKKVVYNISDLDAIYTKNESFLLKLLTESKLKKKIAPKFIESINKPHTVALITELCEGENVENLDSDLQGEISEKVFYLLKEMSNSLDQNQLKQISIRKPISYLISFALNFIKVVIKTPSLFWQYTYYALLFYRSYGSTLWKAPSFALVHRDLYPDNILYNVSNKSITVTDWESAIVSDSLYDLAQITMIYSEKRDFKDTLQLLRNELATSQEEKRYIGLAIFNSIQTLANTEKNHPVFQQTTIFLKTLTQKIIPELRYKKSLYEKLFGTVLYIIYFFYKVTKLSFYSKFKKIVLCYHSVGNTGWRYSMRTDRFKSQLEFLQKNYSVLSLPDFFESKKGGITITFDDGYKDVRENALPILKKMNIHATIFALGDEKNANRKQLDNPFEIMSTQGIKLLYKEGWTIGSHTLTHSHLKEISDETLQEEITNSKTMLEKKVGIPIDFFAYPKGIYSKKIVSFVEQAGYKGAFTTDGYDLTRQFEKPFTLNRILLEYSLTQKQFEALLSPLGLIFSQIAVHVLQLKEMVTVTTKHIAFFLKNLSTHFVKRFLSTTSIVVLLVLLLTPFVKGNKIGSQLLYQNSYQRNVGGPFEASNTTARYALTQAIVQNQTFTLSTILAQFSSPDVVLYNGNFISIFTPGVSFLGIPLYILGSFFGLPQLFSFATILIIGIIDVLLVIHLARKLGATYISAVLGGLLFLFGTNALSYSLTFTQHLTTVMLILLGLENILRPRTIKNNIFLGAIYGAGLLVDIPNAFLLFPILVYGGLKHISIVPNLKRISFAIKSSIIFILLGLLPLVIIFGWYNYETTGSFTKLGQTIGRTTAFQNQNVPPQQSVNSSATFNDEAPKPIGLKLPFSTRAELQGLYILLLSDERSWIFYSPIVFIGLIGLYFLYKNSKTKMLALLAFSIVGLDILLYAMFADPWGGWAFGARYLIPGAAVLCLGIPIAIDKLRKNVIFICVFVVTAFYSLWVNELGALTTSSIPPKVEALNLSTHIPWNYQYNIQLIDKNISSSLVYNVLLSSHISTTQFFDILLGISTSIIFILYAFRLFQREGSK